MTILRSIQNNTPNCSYQVNISLKGLKNAIDQYNVDLNPKYQRGHVWTEEQESLFVGSFLENCRSIPPLWFNWISLDFNRSHSEIVDGKQRIKACLRWIDGEIIAHCPCGESVWIRDMDEIDMRGLSMNTCMQWNFVELNHVEVMKFYLRLNSGGTIHTKKELDTVRKIIENSHK